MNNEDAEDDIANEEWKPFKIYKMAEGFQVSMLGNESDEFKLVSDALIWALEVFTDAWIHHLNIEHDMENKTHIMPDGNT